jgi:hypothetical protein
VLTSVSNVASLERESVSNEAPNDLVKCRLSKKYRKTNNVQEHPKAWRFWDEFFENT